MRIAITGATGYIGRALLRRCLAAGDQVVGLSRSQISTPGVTWMPYDLSTSPNTLPDVDTVVHLAYDQNGLLDVEAERQALIDLMSASPPRARFIFVSSQSAKNPVSEYGRRKLLLEQTVLERDGVVVRPGLVYGGRRSVGLIGTLSRLTRLPALPVPAGHVMVQPVHISTLADALRAVAHEQVDKSIWEFGDASISLADFIRNIAQAKRRFCLLIPLPKLLFQVASVVTPALGGSLRQMFRQKPLDDDLETLRLAHIPLAHGVLPAVKFETRAALVEARAILCTMGLGPNNKAALATYARSLTRLGLRPVHATQAAIKRDVARYLLSLSNSATRSEWRRRTFLAASAYEMTPYGSRKLHRHGDSFPLAALALVILAVVREAALKASQYVKVFLA